MTRVSGPARDPFAVLGLRADDDLTDDDVRIAWRRIAAATHPDRADGGDPDRFALAAAAYTELRTGFGRNEARADLAGVDLPGSAADRIARAARVRQERLGWLSPRRGKVAPVLLRLGAAATAAVLGGTAAGWSTAAAPALVVGALTWFLVTTRSPRASRASRAKGRGAHPSVRASDRQPWRQEKRVTCGINPNGNP